MVCANWRDIGSIRAFYDAHMDMVLPDPPFDYYDPNWPFLTHPRYLPGSRLTGCRFNNSMLAGGAIVRESTIDNSVLGIRTRMNKATVRRSLIMGAEDYPPDAPAVISRIRSAPSVPIVVSASGLFQS